MSKKKQAVKYLLIAGFSFVTLMVSQFAALMLCAPLTLLGIPAALGNVAATVFYVIFAFLLVKLICKLSKTKLSDYRITKPKVKPVWAAAAVIMPLIVIALSLLSGAEWQITQLDSTAAAMLASQIFFISVGAGIVEELIFRGMIMGALESFSNKAVAVIVPSVLFGAVHLMNGRLSVLSTVQLIIAGTAVGILFSLVTIHSESFWSSSLMHIVWNFLVGGSLIKIGAEGSDDTFFSLVLNNKSFLITGGEFGIESSIFSIIAYAVFIVVALVLIKRKVK